LKEWYLTDNYKPTVTSGYESDAISDFAQSNFTDVLETAFSDVVLLYNHDLSECQEIRCVIQGNSADTYLKSMERVALFPIGTVKAGMYIFFENRYWLITGYPSNNKSYEKATVKLCQYKVKWQNSDGTIVERWVNTQSSSKYDDGLKDSNTMTLTSDSIMLLLPNDDESLTLDGKRIFIDKKNPPNKVYLVSRADSVLYDYGEDHGGMFCFITEKTELNESTDRPDLGICDYISPTTPPEEDDKTTISWYMKLRYSTLKIKPLNKSYTVTAHLYNGNGIEVVNNVEYEWTISSNVNEYLTYSINGNSLSISLSTNCEDFGELVTISCMSKYTGHSDSIQLEVSEVW
jgi:hypothetical protein